MKEKDKQIIKNSFLVVADELASTIPGLNIAWGLSKGLYGASLKIRQNRALEWVEMIKNNPSIFVAEILKDENFQDVFVYSLERFIRERNDKKRRIIKNFFLGFSSNENKIEFDIEKMISILDRLSLSDIKVIGDIDLNKKEFYQIYGNKEKNLDSISNLINLGIITMDYASRMSLLAPYVKITDFGKSFIKYIKD